MTRGNPALRKLEIKYSAFPIHQGMRWLIYTQREVKQPFDTGPEHSFTEATAMSREEKEGHSRRLQAPLLGPNMTPHMKAPPFLDYPRDPSVFRTQRHPRSHLTRVPRHDPEEAQHSEAVQDRARASRRLCGPEGRQILLPGEAFQNSVHRG